jgi:hypothetical protein
MSLYLKTEQAMNDTTKILNLVVTIFLDMRDRRFDLRGRGLLIHFWSLSQCGCQHVVPCASILKALHLPWHLVVTEVILYISH